ncbi:putative ABC transport system ATP-binding protein [Lachnospiraceae bacterium PF1-21]|uniref:ABC transporter ATP-binding protein n=1 Tax=Ohessyouella blattaphilus TaxID=2949333 RepID=A0ABT1ELC4_9FIRM|nr:ABC transporter ATP-binding protein [Ohessyouella blattaphilus]MCP1111510.1 ABC transporter ATP-binding protein [Ohessyouella blattaphilus]MCR8564904.1 ABC transporter ATP-binding protein [Ohessyouella blattaphilus]
MYTLKNISVQYSESSKEHYVLKNTNFIADRGTLVCIEGESGAGKSTFINVLAGIQCPTSGQSSFENNRLKLSNQKYMEKFRREKVGVVRQNYALIKEYTVFENIALPLKYRKYKKKSINDKVEKAMKSLGIYDLSLKYPDEISGGERQRVVIARAIVTEPTVVLADEPTAALDKRNTENVLKIFRELSTKGCYVIIATHDIKVSKACDFVYMLKDGELTEIDKKVFLDNISMKNTYVDL